VALSPAAYPERPDARGRSRTKDGRTPEPKRINARLVWDRKRLDQYFDALPSDQQCGKLCPERDEVT